MQPNFADDIPRTDWSKIPVYDHYPHHKITSPETPESCCDGGRCHAPVDKNASTCEKVQAILSIEPSHVPPGVELLTSIFENPQEYVGHGGFKQILDELWELHKRKGADYGTDEDPLANIRSASEMGVAPWRYAAVRANEKMKRIKTFAVKNKLANESLEESLLDLASQAILVLVLLRE